jgi:GntR family transcriptional regulator/MocR family aminotransferase
MILRSETSYWNIHPGLTMPLWDLSIPLDPTLSEPLYLQLVSGLITRIQGGSLKPGDPIPGTRALAEQLGIHRNTVLAAFRELVAEGWIETKVGDGTFVSHSPPLSNTLPRAPRRSTQGQSSVALSAPANPLTPLTRLQAQTGLPDGRLIPAGAFARAYRWALRMVNRDGAPPDPYGPLRLRMALVDMLAYSRGLRSEPDSLIVTPGGGAALGLAADALLSPGDEVVVESPGFPAGWDILRKRGVSLSAVPVDEQGLDTGALAQICSKRSIRAVFTTPQRQYPTTVTMAPTRRMELLDLANRYGFLILEYDHDTEFQFEGVPPLPLASENQGSVVFVGALSKIFAPGMRLGLIHGPADLIHRIALAREIADLPGDPVLEWAIVDLLESGELLRHLNRTRRIYQARRDHLASQLIHAFGDTLSFALPSGGMALWLRALASTDMDAWSMEAARQGVILRPSKFFELEKNAAPAARLAFGAHDEGELTDLVQRLKACQTAGMG